MHTRNFRLPSAPLVALGIALLATACSDGGDSNSGGAAADSFGLLKPAGSEQEMLESLRSARASASIDSSFLGMTPPVSNDQGLGVSFDTPAYSVTNVQEAGVDEADAVKYDGNILYVADYNVDSDAFDAGISLYPESRTVRITLLRADADSASTDQLAQIEFDTDYPRGGLYLFENSAGKQLLNVSGSSTIDSWTQFALDAYWQGQHTEVRAWDVSDPQHPASAWSLTLEGSLLTSRRVDNMLYLVTRFSLDVDGLLPWPASDAEVAANRALVDSIPLSNWLPDMTRDDGAPRELVAATDCYLPNNQYQDLTVPPASGSLITVTAIDLAAPDSIASLCLNTFASGYYMSRENLYITSHSDNQTTQIHKIGLAQGVPQYRGSGQVSGYLGTHNPAFVMSEHDGDLRVVSSHWSQGFPGPVALVGEEAATGVTPAAEFGRHFLTVLREDSARQRLQRVAQLPNDSRPAPIGKPGEDLYAARFLGDRAYLVTFETIDPLYVLDLSDAQDPRIAGELELPGFSTLLQPLDGGLLLGVGSAVSPDLPVPEGVKVALFNVADIANPVELGNVVIGERGSYSPALHDHRALSLLQVDSGFRATLPVSRYAYLASQPQEPWQWLDDALYEFEVDIAAGSLRQAGRIVSEERSEQQHYPQRQLQHSRGVLQGNAVFFVQPPQVHAAFWGM
ncbi:MAG: hypothetical protein CME59_05410 [Halioglobus sp.]|nr:hypothetical protein [Halioglobus sp.]|tara:strand:+ start:997 stop:3042 length:2046 start_codon:yes stop_codon:yes gene_type:complete